MQKNLCTSKSILNKFIPLFFIYFNSKAFQMTIMLYLADKTQKYIVRL